MALKIIDSYSESNHNSNFSVSAIQGPAVAQSFTGDGGVLNSAKFYLAKRNSPTGNGYAKIYAHSGTFGVDGVPTGSVLATSDAIDVSTIPTSSTLITFQFTGGNKITLTNGTKYFVSFEYSGGDGTNFIYFGIDTTSPTHGGNVARYISSWLASGSYDGIFYVYADVPSSSPLPTHFNL